MKAKLEVQRILLREKLEQLGNTELPSGLRLDTDADLISSSVSNVCRLWQPAAVCVLLKPLS